MHLCFTGLTEGQNSAALSSVLMTTSVSRTRYAETQPHPLTYDQDMVLEDVTELYVYIQVYLGDMTGLTKQRLLRKPHQTP